MVRRIECLGKCHLGTFKLLGDDDFLIQIITVTDS